MDSHINPSHGGNSSSLDTLKPSVLTTTIILLITLTISVSICFLLRFLNRCNRHSPLSPSPSHSLPATERSSSLPIFKFSSVVRSTSSSSTNSSGDCAVCLSKFEPDDQLRRLPLCCHAFHADCIDTWLASNQTCPLCRSPLFASDSDSDSDPTKVLRREGDNSFRLEIGSISRRNDPIPEESGDRRRSYSIGSFDYIVEDVESEISESNFDQSRKHEDAAATAVAVNPAFEASLAGEIGNEGSRSWIKDYVERLSHGISFRSSGSFFTGSSRRSEEEMTVVDLEANHTGEEISELFRWFSGM
ncbi:unnamed protein product [Eruca vesicaria subsp. sativa]|uniref:RING-type E3 ubiquitin transferase n=1 Tax=Eruca vesicaria subsp. sativa TaxID=29727 RepID=A0ABC8IWM0_ERUVS|nr:unnamed protein product [Eruca vesicaria subsp. sativa]